MHRHIRGDGKETGIFITISTNVNNSVTEKLYCRSFSAARFPWLISIWQCQHSFLYARGNLLCYTYIPISLRVFSTFYFIRLVTSHRRHSFLIGILFLTVCCLRTFHISFLFCSSYCSESFYIFFFLLPFRKWQRERTCASMKHHKKIPTRNGQRNVKRANKKK